MKLPSYVIAIRAQFSAKFPVPSISNGEDQQVYEERCRRWSIMCAEQVAFQFPDGGWGVKRGDSGRPICKDCIAQLRADGTLLSWDMLQGASMGHPTPMANPDSMDLTGPPDGPQFFENRPAYFNPRNHVGTPATVPVVGHIPDVTIPPAKVLDDYFAFGKMLRALYDRDLNRDILTDPDAMVNWLYHWRENNRDEAWIESMIRTSAEWKKLHPTAA